jgi:hypothetical protein
LFFEENLAWGSSSFFLKLELLENINLIVICTGSLVGNHFLLFSRTLFLQKNMPRVPKKKMAVLRSTRHETSHPPAFTTDDYYRVSYHTPLDYINEPSSEPPTVYEYPAGAPPSELERLPALFPVWEYNLDTFSYIDPGMSAAKKNKILQTALQTIKVHLKYMEHEREKNQAKRHDFKSLVRFIKYHEIRK